MADSERQHPLSWRQIQELSQQVRGQLEGTDESAQEAQASMTQPVEVAPAPRSNRAATVAAIVAGIVVFGGLTYLIRQGAGKITPDINDSIKGAGPVWISIPIGHHQSRRFLDSCAIRLLNLGSIAFLT